MNFASSQKPQIWIHGDAYTIHLSMWVYDKKLMKSST